MRAHGDGVRNDIGGGYFAAPVVMVGHAQTVHLPGGQSSRAVPHQTQRFRGDFVNRSAELERIGAAVDSGAVVGLSGPSGMGKTALALQWLHAEQHRFPDGQLCLDLGGAVSPMRPSDALGALLRSLGADPVGIPASYDERYRLFLSLTAGSRLVLFLENAATAAQVRQLLPATGVAVLVSSRAGLSGLHRDGPFVDIVVKPLDAEASSKLVRRITRRDFVAETSASRLVSMCAGNPLALVGMAALIANRPYVPEERWAQDLSDGRHGLITLAIPGDDSLSRAFAVTYAGLPAPLARIYRVMGLHVTPEFDVGVAAVALDIDVRRAEEGLLALVDHRLLEQLSERRFRFHDLHWSHAGERAVAEEAAPERIRIVRAVLGWYLEGAAAADLAIARKRWREGRIFEIVEAKPPVFADREQARAWLDLEGANITAAVLFAEHPSAVQDQLWIDAVAWQLCIAGWPLYFGRKRFEDWMRTHTVGIGAAQRLDDDLAASKLFSQRGFAYLGMERPAEAAEDFLMGLRAGEHSGSTQAMSTAIESLGLAALARKRYPEALERFEQALAIVADPPLAPLTIALLHHHHGRALSGCGRHAEALTELIETRAAMREIGDRYNEGRVLTSLGEAYRRAGQDGPAADSLSAALDIMRAESVFETGQVAVALADLAEASGDPARTRALLEEALAAYVTLLAPQAKTVEQRLASLPPA